MKRWLALVVLALGGAGCGRVPGSASGAPWRVRLWEAPGVLASVPPRAPVSLLSEDFTQPLSDWHVLTDQRDVLTVAAGALRQTQGREGERDFLTLSGTLGAVYRVLAVEPDTTYAFRGTLRARALSGADEAFFGATFWVGEFSRAGTPAELFANGGWVDRHHGIPSARGEEGWRERALVFRTQPTTRALVVGCVLAVDAPLTAGEVDFDRLELSAVDPREFWEYEAAREVARRHRGEPPLPAGDWRARRSVSAMFGFEERPSILLLPGEKLALTVRVPEHEPELVLAAAPWPPAFRAGVAGELVVQHESGLMRTGVKAAAALTEIQWSRVAWGQADAGAEVTLVLACQGELPLVVGAPELVGRAPSARPPSVILVSIDTLRADKVGAYGATSGATPHLDALAARATVFTDVSANAPYTLPAHSTLFSGQFPSVHGVEDKGRVLSSRRSPVLARELAAHAYRTQAFTSAVFLTPQFGFAQGFDGFSIVDPFRHAESRFFEELARTAPEQGLTPHLREGGMARVGQWLEQHADEPFFLFLHTYEVHDYDPPRAGEPCPVAGCGIAGLDYREFLLKKKTPQPFPGTERERAHIGHLYDQALAHVDRELGRLLAELARLGLEDETIVAVTSDHGEELFERGFLQHGKSLHRENLAIPWILRVPGAPPARLAQPAMQVDLLPTLLGRLGLAVDARVQGRDLLGAGGAAPLWSEVNDAFARQTSLRAGDWKLVHAPPDAPVAFPAAQEWRLYDLARDPWEREEASARAPERLAELRELHGRLRAELAQRAEALGPLEDDGELEQAFQELLDDLGYN